MVAQMFMFSSSKLVIYGHITVILVVIMTFSSAIVNFSVSKRVVVI